MIAFPLFVLLKVGFEPDWRRWLAGETERPGREEEEGDLESRDEPRRAELPPDSLPRTKLFGNSLDSNPDIIEAMLRRDCFLDTAGSHEVDDTSDFESSSSPTIHPVDARSSFSRSNWSEDRRGGSSASALGLSGELGADAMAEELMRNGEETRGSTGLRLPRLEDNVTPPIAKPALLADCGVLSKFPTVRLSPDDVWFLAVADEELDGDRRSEIFARGSDAPSENLGELRRAWYDIACGSASGGLDLLWRTRRAAQPTRCHTLECGADRPPL